MMYYEGPIIDTHHHLWDVTIAHYPWLNNQELSETEEYYGRTPFLPKTYQVSDYFNDLKKYNLFGCVHIEAGRSNDDAFDETKWINSLYEDNSRVISSENLRIVAKVNLDKKTVRETIDQQAEFPHVVGVRDILSWHFDHLKSFNTIVDRMLTAEFCSGLNYLQEKNLHFEVMLFPWQISSMCQVIKKFPKLRFVINHCASPIDRSLDGMTLWKRGLYELAQYENTFLKISNPAAYDPNWNVESLQATIETCVEIFSATRCMFGTDLPVMKKYATMHEYFNVLHLAFESLSQNERRAIFFGNAVKFYCFDINEIKIKHSELRMNHVY